MRCNDYDSDEMGIRWKKQGRIICKDSWCLIVIRCHEDRYFMGIIWLQEKTRAISIAGYSKIELFLHDNKTTLHLSIQTGTWRSARHFINGIPFNKFEMPEVIMINTVCSTIR